MMKTRSMTRLCALFLVWLPLVGCSVSDDDILDDEGNVNQNGNEGNANDNANANDNTNGDANSNDNGNSNTNDNVNANVNGNVNDNITIAGGATVVLSAPSDGPLPGILFYHDRNGSGNITHTLTGGANMQLNGIIYFPTTDLVFTGGAELNESASIIIADEVTFTGDVYLGGFTTAPGNAILGNSLMLQATLLE